MLCFNVVTSDFLLFRHFDLLLVHDTTGFSDDFGMEDHNGHPIDNDLSHLYGGTIYGLLFAITYYIFVVNFLFHLLLFLNFKICLFTQKSQFNLFTVVTLLSTLLSLCLSQ